MGKKTAMAVQCCVCHRVRGPGGRFKRIKLPEGAEVSHTYCPKCAAEAYARLEETRRRKVLSKL